MCTGIYSRNFETQRRNDAGYGAAEPVIVWKFANGQAESIQRFGPRASSGRSRERLGIEVPGFHSAAQYSRGKSRFSKKVLASYSGLENEARHRQRFVLDEVRAKLDRVAVARTKNIQ